MKIKIILFGIALVLALCISPVAAVCGDGFEIVEDWSGRIASYTYCYKDDPNETYTQIYTDGSYNSYSLVTFEPANIPDAPKMFVNTTGARYIYLPRCVDDWEIRYYYCYSDMDYGDHSRHNHLKYAGVVNLNEYFGEYIKRGLFFRTYHKPLIQCQVLLDSSPVYFFPEED